MNRIYYYTESEAENLVVVKGVGFLLIKVGDEIFMTDDPEEPPHGKETKTLEVSVHTTINQIFKAITDKKFTPAPAPEKEEQ